MRRGFASLALLLVFLPSLLLLLELQTISSGSLSRELVLEKRFYLEQEFKEAVQVALQGVQGNSREEKAMNAAERLEELEKKFEEKMALDGISADVWIGASSEIELSELRGNVFKQKKALKCWNCFDLREKTVNQRKEVVHRSIAFLDVNEPDSSRVTVSLTGLSFLPTEALNVRVSSSAFIGLSAYFEGTAFVSLVPEGF